ncbi:hypothetical protein LLT7_13765, partial [Lactococcus cremoris subsp. cremoris TIFN7]
PNFSKRRKVIERVFSFLTNLGAERCKGSFASRFSIEIRDDTFSVFFTVKIS